LAELVCNLIRVVRASARRLSDGVYRNGDLAMTGFESIPYRRATMFWSWSLFYLVVERVGQDCPNTLASVV
jgi:hypothetical protein